MQFDRRALLAGIGAIALAPRVSLASKAKDAAGRFIETPDKVARVFPAGPPAAIMLYTLAPDLLLGWPRANRPEELEFLDPKFGALPEIGRITGRGNTANLEVVLALKPDLIVDVGSTSATFVSLAERVREQTGIPYALLDGRIDAIAESYRILGSLTGREKRGEELAAYSSMMFATLKSYVAKVPDAGKPRVYYARGPRGLETGLGGSINVESIEILAKNVAGDVRGGLATVSIEQVLVWNPDVIITIDQNFAQTVRSDPAWAGVSAVQKGRVHLSPKLPFGWVDFPPSVNRLIGLWWLAKIFYPDRISENIETLTRDFYKRFYHVDITDAQLARVLAGRG